MRLSLGLAVPAVLLLACQPHWGQATTWHSSIAKVSVKQSLNRRPGTAFVVALRSGNAYLVTSAHVVEGDEKPRIVFEADSERAYDAEVRDVEAGEERGLALLVVDKPPSGVTAVPAADQVFDRQTKVDVAGYPGGDFTIIDTTIASRKGRDVTLARATVEGFSGGPVLVNGTVVGLVFGHGNFGKALGVVSVKEYLTGHKVTWGGEAPSVERVTRPPAGPRPGEERSNPRDGLTYVWVPPGQFTMGCSPGDQECDSDESPPHLVAITKGFWMSKSEVTQAAYQRVAGSNPSYSKGANRPVEQVSWTEADGYCRKIGGRLPTEAEWEYAARAGSKGARYGELDKIAWFGGNSNATTHDVMTKARNDFGLHDMIGNVWEWVADWYSPYAAAPATDPRGPNSGQYRTLRGGSWYGTRYARASNRNWSVVEDRDNNIVFRCVGEFP